MKDEILDKLYKPFDLKERQGLGGMTFKYVSSNDIIDRMNKLFAGCWSTIIMDQEKMEDFVLVRVKVMVYDKETERMYEHEGYGSGKIMKYTSGAKKGEVIDVGNAYKAAEAKAIKNACSRWGVGLYLEEPEEALPTEVFIPDNTPPDPILEKEIPTETVSDFIPPTEEEDEKDNLELPPLPPLPPSDIPYSARDVEEPVEEKTNDISIANEQDAELKISDVQRVALKSLMKLKKLNFNDLVVEALSGGGGTLPSAVEDLSYQQAITIIKFGNDMVKK
jgi:hypothetical protein